MARDFLDQVDLAHDVHAARRHRDLPPFGVGRQAEIESLEDSRYGRIGDRDAEQTENLPAPQPQRGGFPPVGIAVEDRTPRPPGPDLLEEGQRTCHGQQGQVRIGAALETHAGFRLQPELLAGAPHGERVEIGALEHDGLRRARHLGVGAAHDTRDGAGPLGIGDDEHLRRECPRLAVEGLERFTRPRGPDTDLPAGQRGEVERVHRLSEFQEHVVRDVDDVADRADAGRLQSSLHPGRGWGDRHVGDGADIAGAEFRALEHDVDVRCGGVGLRACGVRIRRVPTASRRRQRQSVRRSDLARHADDGHGIRTIGGDLEIEHRIAVANGLDALDGETAHRHRLRNGLRRAGNVDTLTQPGEEDSHSGNCSRKRMSFS